LQIQYFQILHHRLNADGAANWQYNGVIPAGITGSATDVDEGATSAFMQPRIDFSKAVTKGYENKLVQPAAQPSRGASLSFA